MPENVAIAMPMPLPIPGDTCLDAAGYDVIVILATPAPTRPQAGQTTPPKSQTSVEQALCGVVVGVRVRSLSGTTGSIGARGTGWCEITLPDPVVTRACFSGSAVQLFFRSSRR